MPTTERTIKITLLGGSESGKTSVIQSLLGPTITYINASEISIPQHIIDIDGENITLQYRDFASNPTPEVASVIPTYIPSTQLFIGCFDLTRAEDSLTQLKAALVTQCRLAPNANIIIVGTKADLTANYSRRNVKSLFKAFIADLNQSTLKNRIVTDHYLPMSDRDKARVQDLKKTIATQIQSLPKRTPTSGDTTMPNPITDIDTSETKPSAFERLKNFFKHRYFKRGLMLLGIGIGIGLAVTGVGMIGLAAAGIFSITAASVALAASMFTALGGTLGFWLTAGALLLGGVAAVAGTIGLTLKLRSPALHAKKPAKTAVNLTSTTDGKVNQALSEKYVHRPWTENTGAPIKPRTFIASDASAVDALAKVGVMPAVRAQAGDISAPERAPSPTNT